ncbi:MAG: NAD(+)/NADH kinase [Lachnospiraceae bacterium]|jgi:NAD+ kinase|nr:NAD(+)/NADH kinase [Lachnospiraceae bacterium]
MAKVLIITNDSKDAALRVAHDIKMRIENDGGIGILCKKNSDKTIDISSLPGEIDSAIVIGGDGSLIEAARILHGRGVPLLGVNMGNLGYLAECEVQDIDIAIKRLLTGDYTVENRMMLEGVIGETDQKVALNDIVVSRQGALRIIRFNLYVDGEYLNSYEADGIILSTPTGSTAYNLSAGGPIVEPTAQLIVVTPICPHGLHTGSIILSSEKSVTVEIGNGRSNDSQKGDIIATFDGADAASLSVGESVIVRKADAMTRFIKLSKVSFLETLRRKMKGN